MLLKQQDLRSHSVCSHLRCFMVSFSVIENLTWQHFSGVIAGVLHSTSQTALFIHWDSFISRPSYILSVFGTSKLCWRQPYIHNKSEWLHSAFILSKVSLTFMVTVQAALRSNTFFFYISWTPSRTAVHFIMKQFPQYQGRGPVLCKTVLFFPQWNSRSVCPCVCEWALNQTQWWVPHVI